MLTLLFTTLLRRDEMDAMIEAGKGREG